MLRRPFYDHPLRRDLHGAILMSLLTLGIFTAVFCAARMLRLATEDHQVPKFSGAAILNDFSSAPPPFATCGRVDGTDFVGLIHVNTWAKDDPDYGVVAWWPDLLPLVDDLVLTHSPSHVKFYPERDVAITGFAEGYDGEYRVFENISDHEITLSYESYRSRGANRILTADQRDAVLPPNTGVVVVYRGDVKRWFVERPTEYETCNLIFGVSYLAPPSCVVYDATGAYAVSADQISLTHVMTGTTLRYVCAPAR